MAEERAFHLSSARLDALLAEELGGAVFDQSSDDATFLRRASLDLIGRQPTVDELDAFLVDPTSDRRRRAIDRQLAMPELGRNWANYWTDTIRHQVVPPAGLILDYKPLRGWLTAELNAGTGWDAVVREFITATGTIEEKPQTTFLVYHDARPTKLASETTRVFLGLQIACAECHDHPFDKWKRDEFHGLAAFFGKLKQTREKGGPVSGVTLIEERRYRRFDSNVPKKKRPVILPALFDRPRMTSEEYKKDDPRQLLAGWITSPTNPWFSKAYVNRIWARLMGRGFYEPVDKLSGQGTPVLPRTHAALAAHFAATGFDVKLLFRLLMNTRAYQRRLVGAEEQSGALGTHQARLRGDEMFDSLRVALGIRDERLPPPANDEEAAVRRRTADTTPRAVIAGCLAYDPSLGQKDIQPSFRQALLLMNDARIARQIDADPKSGTQLAWLLVNQPDDRLAVLRLYKQVLAREPVERELTFSLEHIASADRRGAAYEDLLWSLINSAEFSTRR